MIANKAKFAITLYRSWNVENTSALMLRFRRKCKSSRRANPRRPFVRDVSNARLFSGNVCNRGSILERGMQITPAVSRACGQKFARKINCTRTYQVPLPEKSPETYLRIPEYIKGPTEMKIERNIVLLRRG